MGLHIIARLASKLKYVLQYVTKQRVGVSSAVLNIETTIIGLPQLTIDGPIIFRLTVYICFAARSFLTL